MAVASLVAPILELVLFSLFIIVFVCCCYVGEEIGLVV